MTQTHDSEALRPCPFCGSKEVALHGGIDHSWGRCMTCGSMGSAHESFNGATTAWNARTTPQPAMSGGAAEALAELQSMSDHVGRAEVLGNTIRTALSLTGELCEVLEAVMTYSGPRNSSEVAIRETYIRRAAALLSRVREG